MNYTFHIVDVFSSTPFGGNQLAVLLDAAGISTEDMQKIARDSPLKLQRVYAFVERRMTCALVPFRIPS